MNDRMLGPSYQSFGPNFRVTLALVGIGGLFCWLAYEAALEFHERIAWIVFYVLSVGFGLLAALHLSFRVWVHEGGLVCRGLFGRSAIPWREINRIYFASYDIHAHYVALGTFYRLRLITKRGKNLSIGERLHGAKDLGELIQSHTLAEMLQKAKHEFENGVELDFERIRISRKAGVKYHKWFKWREIRWRDLTEYRVSDSHVNFKGAKNLFKVNIPTEKISNTHVLKEILDQVRAEKLRVGF
jgi:hypothetical protein